MLIVLGALALSACRPEVSFDADGRQSQIDEVDVTATLGADGVVHVSSRYTFESDDGGTVGVPDLSSGVIGGAANVTVDGAPATPTGGTFNAELDVKGRTATVAYDLVGEVQRYLDIGVVELDVLPAPADASRQDPDVTLRGTFTIPEGPPGTFEAHLHGGRDLVATINGRVVEFSAEAPIWMPFHRIAVAFPAGAVPFVSQTPIPFLAQFQATQAIREAADATTESTLSTVESGEELGRWVITGVAFGLPAIFWTIFGLGVLRRLRQRQQMVGDVPDHLSDPPTQADPAVVAVLEGEGRPARPAIAGTVLALAQRKALEIQKYGDKLVVKIPLTTTPTNDSERIVLDALRKEASPDGVIEGPPVLREPATWWRAFRRDAIKQARGMGLVHGSSRGSRRSSAGTRSRTRAGVTARSGRRSPSTSATRASSTRTWDRRVSSVGVRTSSTARCSARPTQPPGHCFPDRVYAPARDGRRPRDHQRPRA